MATRKPPTIGSDIDQLADLRDRRWALEKEADALEQEAKEIEERLIKTLDKEGIDKSSGKKASVSISATTSANVEDWDAFLAYVYKMKYGHLLQRRISDPAYRELLEAGKKVPGTQPFTKRRLNLRSLTS